MNNTVTVSVKLNAFTPCIQAVLVAQGYSYSALLNDINAELGKAAIRDQELKTGSTRYSKKADETTTSGGVTFRAVNQGTTVPLQFKAFNDSIAKLVKQFPSMELGKDFVFPVQFSEWLASKRTVKPAKQGNGKQGKQETVTTPVETPKQ